MDSIKMSVSPVFSREGKKYAFVSFEDADRRAEGKIPDCVIISNSGFSKEETVQLELYMRAELKNLKKMAAGTNVLKAFMKDG